MEAALGLLEVAWILAHAGSEALCLRKCRQLMHLIGVCVHLVCSLQVVSMQVWEEVVCAETETAQQGGREYCFSW